MADMAETHQHVAGSDWQVEVDSMTAEKWSAELENFDDASVYQTWAYGEVSWGRKQLSHVVLRRGGKVVGMAQLRVIQIPVFGRGIAYVRWAPLWRRKGGPQNCAVLSRMIEALHEEYVRRRKLLLRIIPNVFAGDPAESALLSSFDQWGLQPARNHSSYRTFILDLTASMDQLRKNLDGKWRNQLNRAEKNNLTIVEGADERLYGIFKTIYNEMMDRKAFETTVDIEVFERIQSLLQPSQKIYTLLALKDEKPVSALLGSIIGDTGIYLLGATSNEGMQHKGSYLLQWRMIQKLKELGCRAYDLGGINPERNPGVYHFKSGFSGQDKTQVGQFEVSGSWLSSVIVKLAERSRHNSRPTRQRPAAAADASCAPLTPAPQES